MISDRSPACRSRARPRRWKYLSCWPMVNHADDAMREFVVTFTARSAPIANASSSKPRRHLPRPRRCDRTTCCALITTDALRLSRSAPEPGWQGVLKLETK
jgi:hypothetical protein